MNKEGVLVIGSANIDLVVTSKRFPRPGETIFGKSFQMFPGGKGANQAVSCAKLGAPTLFIGKIGNDEHSEILKKSLVDNGVCIEDILIDENTHTGVALISVDAAGENEIIVISGSNMNFTPEDLTLKKDNFNKVKVVLTQLEIPLKTVQLAAELAIENESVFILNPAPAIELPLELLPLIDFITPNKTELELLTDTRIKEYKDVEIAAKKLLTKGVKNVIVTLGREGALFINQNTCKKFDALSVEAKDSTAAGDSFNGALAFSISEGKCVEDAIRFANTAAALSVKKMGAQNSMPNYSDVEKAIYLPRT